MCCIEAAHLLAWENIYSSIFYYLKRNEYIMTYLRVCLNIWTFIYSADIAKECATLSITEQQIREENIIMSGTSWASNREFISTGSLPSKILLL